MVIKAAVVKIDLPISNELDDDGSMSVIISAEWAWICNKLSLYIYRILYTILFYLELHSKQYAIWNNDYSLVQLAVYLAGYLLSVALN